MDFFSNLPTYAGDPILDLIGQYQRDSRPNKVNLGVGIYYDDSGRIPFLPSVLQAEQRYLISRQAVSYLPMEGDAAYRQAVRELLFGTTSGSGPSGEISVVQTVGGSGALKLGADFLKRFHAASRVFVSDPTWDNHVGIFEGAGFEVTRYRYFDANSKGLDLDGMLDDLKRMQSRDIVLFAPCCHNPTGVDPTREQWLAILDVVQARDAIPFVDIAYQGFAEDLDSDAWLIREMASRGMDFLVSSSFSKIFSLYGERCGALSVHTCNVSHAANVLGQLKLCVRRNYSSPPTHGMALVTRVLNDTALRGQWIGELRAMRQRIHEMRHGLRLALQQRSAGFDASFLVSQRGMFAYTGLSPKQVNALRDESAIYAVESGRICVAGLNSSNLDYVAEAIAKVL
jgi:aromatic-amino-acid transaminase